MSRSKQDNISSCGIVSEGAGADEKQGICFAWPNIAMCKCMYHSLSS